MLANPGAFLRIVNIRDFLDQDLYFATIALLGWGTILLPRDIYRLSGRPAADGGSRWQLAED